MNVLIACEESQTVCIEFRKRGHNAFSCDLQECSGGHPEWHIKTDVRNVLNDPRIWKMGPSKERSKLRSKTYVGIAKAMAEQWG